MSTRDCCIVMVGAFPPPVHGMAAVNAAVREALYETQAEPQVIDLAAPSLDRSLTARLGRVPRVRRGLVRLAAARGLRGGTLYMSVSGGFGQLYELAFVALARLRGMNLYLHHHTFAYLDRPSRLSRQLFCVAGSRANHVALSSGMVARLKERYRVHKVVAISNAVFFPPDGSLEGGASRHKLQTLGFISNIAAEKGVFEFLDLMASAQDAGLPLRAKLAGPFQDTQTEDRVRAWLAVLPSVEYVGPQYGAEKDAFFATIDALIFPTRYVNEAEPLTLHEAMNRSIPVIAYGRGAIPEIVGPGCGLVIDPDQPFVPAALAQIEAWLTDPLAFEAASEAAAERFAQTYAESHARWQALLGKLAGTVAVSAPELEDSL